MNKKRERREEGKIRLSGRLSAIASFVPAGSVAADVGTDHGYIPLWLVQEGICPAAIAMDVRPGPLERAAAHVREAGCSDRISLRLSDGLDALLPGEAGAVIIAGMGGLLTVQILERGRRIWESWEPERERLILSPHSEIAGVRAFLEETGFLILRETMVREDGKYYVIMEAARGRMRPLTEAEREFGPCLLRDGHPLLAEYLKKEKETARALIGRLEAAMGNLLRVKEPGAADGSGTQEAAGRPGRTDAEKRLAARQEELCARIRMIEEAEDEMQRNNQRAGEAGASLDGLRLG